MGAMRSFTRKDDNSTLYRQVMSALDGVSKIRLGTSNRPECPIETRCNKLRGIEDALVTLDRFQRRGAIETVRGVQRIRGLAGSGKTVVLARKAAYLHVLHPEWVIGVTFHTRSLKAHFRRLIRRFVYEDGRVEPNWDKLHIINAWGASGAAHRTGIYHQFCTQHDLEYLDFRRASSSFGRDRAFDSICKKAIQESDSLTPYYDAILIDEAQDLPPSFLRLCHHFLKPPKRLVYCYDELQNLTGESLPPPEDIFGRRNGSPVVRLPASQGPAPKPDIVLPTCYRTPGPVLVVAHAIGFGIYRRPSSDSSTGLVQMFDHPILWEDIGYKVVERLHQRVKSMRWNSSFSERPVHHRLRRLSHWAQSNRGEEGLHHSGVRPCTIDSTETFLEPSTRHLCESGLRENRTSRLSGGRRLALRGASSDPTAMKPANKAGVPSWRSQWSEASHPRGNREVPHVRHVGAWIRRGVSSRADDESLIPRGPFQPGRSCPIQML